MKKILIVDDEDYITEVIGMFADELGYTADISSDGSRAIEMIRDNNYWAVFCDLMMPGLNGIEIFKKLGEINSGLCKRFVLITGAILDQKIEEKAAKDDMIVFRKPFNFDDIRKVFLSLENRI